MSPLGRQALGHKECGTPEKGLKWVVPESVRKEHQKEAAAMAERANKGEFKGLCYKPIRLDLG